MRPVIKTTSISADKGMLSSLDHAVLAAVQCFRNAGLNRHDIDMVIFTGIKHKPSDEPVSSYILRELDRRLEPSENTDNKSTVAVDMVDGECGLINASRMVDDYLKNSKVNHAMVISCDEYPSTNEKGAFPYSTLGAAVILGHQAKINTGFRDFHPACSDKEGHDVSGSEPHNSALHGKEADSDAARADDKGMVDNAVYSVMEYIKSCRTDVNDIKCLITSHPDLSFGEKIAGAIGLDSGKVVNVHSEYGNHKSSAMAVGFHMISRRGFLNHGGVVLFVSININNSVSCAIYDI
jgi:3-oxoacyl-[acyl-carrier-protein] synthase III